MFVEMHHQVDFFDLWELDSLLKQFLKLDTILEKQQHNPGDE